MELVERFAEDYGERERAHPRNLPVVNEILTQTMFETAAGCLERIVARSLAKEYVSIEIRHPCNLPEKNRMRR